MAETNTSDRDAASREYMHLLETYYQQREQEDALRSSRLQVASRLKEIGGRMDGWRIAAEGAAGVAQRGAE